MPPYDVNQMAEQLLSMLDAPAEEKQHLGEEARQLIIDNYAKKVCLPKLAKFYLGNSDNTEKPALDQLRGASV